MIKVQKLSKHFGKVKAVDEISFEVKEHENLILLGTSGSGKTLR
jgi:osmoprotectant transport system ATP-binding protein